jgi:hypothetical protein
MGCGRPYLTCPLISPAPLPRHLNGLMSFLRLLLTLRWVAWKTSLVPHKNLSKILRMELHLSMGGALRLESEKTPPPQDHVLTHFSIFPRFQCPPRLTPSSELPLKIHLKTPLKKSHPHQDPGSLHV